MSDEQKVTPAAKPTPRAYAIATRNGNIILGTVRRCAREARFLAAQEFSDGWSQAHKLGWRCVRVSVVPARGVTP